VFHGGIHEVDFGYHRSLSKRFPFAIYYRVDGNVVTVVAVLDARRNPLWIRNRLT
jgi:plasmid stabilization system protein ParE